MSEFFPFPRGNGSGTEKPIRLKDAGTRLVVELSRSINYARKIGSAVQHWGVSRLANFPNLNPHPVLECNPQGQVTYANPVASRLLKNSSHKGLLPVELRELIPRCLKEIIEITGQETEINGRTLLWSLQPFPATGRVYLYAVDITEQKRLEAQLRQAQKMEAGGQMAGGLAHDFNNLLMIIGGYGELAAGQAESGSPVHESIEEIRKAAERAGSLTRQLLSFSRRQLLQPKILNLNGLVADMAKLLGSLLGDEIELTTHLDSDLGCIKADPAQLEQVIVNLALNARDAMPQGGKLTIETTNLPIEESLSSHSESAQPTSQVMLAITDTGVGMDAETQSHIFEPFFTTKENGKGTGLGLSTVYGVVKQSGGKLAVESELGRGTAFKIYLPRVEEAIEPTPEISSLIEPSKGSETILLVDDEMAIRKVTREFLEASGYSVLEACNGPEALKLCEQHRGELHMVMTDVRMPGLSGHQLAQELSTRYPKLKVLFMSGIQEDAFSEICSLAPANTFLQKPFTFVELGGRLREMLQAN